ncbi:MAG: hypothetical protein ACRYF1_13750 [Janthinobacterium lividum]
MFDAWLNALAVWTPRNRREIVQACAILRHLLDHVDLPDTALVELRAALVDVVRRLRSGCPEAARAIRALPQAAARAGLDPAHDGPESDALAAIVRACGPFGGNRGPHDRARRVERRGAL